MGRKRTDIVQRFWSKVNIGGVDECWSWTGTQYKSKYVDKEDNYGDFKGEGRDNIKAHRFSYCLHTGKSLTEIKGVVIRHTCDNRTCVNPAHLLPGTCYDNYKDAMIRNRLTHGESHHAAVITEEQALHICRLLSTTTLTQVDIAKNFGIGTSVVNDICNGRLWKHLTHGVPIRAIGQRKKRVDTRLTPEIEAMVRGMRKDRKEGMTVSMLMKKYKRSNSNCTQIISGKCWPQVI